VPTIVALTKIDKLKPREVLKRVHEIAVALRLEDEQMIPFSAETNQGRDDLAEAVVSLVRMPSWRTVAAPDEVETADAPPTEAAPGELP